MGALAGKAMTEPERQALRLALDVAKRVQLAEGQPLACEQCGATMELHPHGRAKRFCGNRCRTYAWYRNTERGRAAARAKKRRVYARGGGIKAQRARQRAEVAAL